MSFYYLLAKVGLDTAENEPPKVWGPWNIKKREPTYFSLGPAGGRAAVPRPPEVRGSRLGAPAGDEAAGERALRGARRARRRGRRAGEGRVDAAAPRGAAKDTSE